MTEPLRILTSLPPPRTEEERERREKALRQLEEHFDEMFEEDEDHGDL